LSEIQFPVLRDPHTPAKDTPPSYKYIYQSTQHILDYIHVHKASEIVCA